MPMNSFAPYLNRYQSFVVRNVTTDRQKTIKIFNHSILYNQTRDLLKIPGIGEADIRASLLKGELYHKLLAGDIVIVYSDIDLLQFNDDQKTFLTNSGVTKGLTVTTGQTIPQSATDPTSPPPVDGDLYYNTVLLEDMRYDGVRSKWLSIVEFPCYAGRLGNTAAGSFYRGFDNITFGTNIGIPVPKGTLVGISYSKTDANTSTLEILVDGVVIDSLISSVVGQISIWNSNANFSQGLMQFRNKLGGATTTDVQITALYRKRS